MYHYTECGLDNVWLVNGFNKKNTAYGQAVSITEANSLHQLLANHLINKPARLTGKEFRFLRVILKLSQAAVAKIQGVSEQNISLWERHGKIPKANDHLMRLFYMAHESKNHSLRQACERMTTVERLIHQRIVAQTRGVDKVFWSSKVEETENNQPSTLPAQCSTVPTAC